MADINAANKADNLPELQMAIALNTGDVVAGNIGSERRSKYGFVGHPVNVTSRIEDDAKPGEILVSHSTAPLRLQRHSNLASPAHLPRVLPRH